MLQRLSQHVRSRLPMQLHRVSSLICSILKSNEVGFQHASARIGIGEELHGVRVQVDALAEEVLSSISHDGHVEGIVLEEYRTSRRVDGWPLVHALWIGWSDHRRTHSHDSPDHQACWTTATAVGHRIFQEFSSVVARPVSVPDSASPHAPPPAASARSSPMASPALCTRHSAGRRRKASRCAGIRYPFAF